MGAESRSQKQAGPLNPWIDLAAALGLLGALLLWMLNFFAHQSAVDHKFSQLESAQKEIAKDVSQIKDDISYIRGLMERRKNK